MVRRRERLAARPPFDALEALTFMGRRTIPGVEVWDGQRYARTLDLVDGHATVTVTPDGGGVVVDVVATTPGDAKRALGAVAHLLDLAADPAAIGDVLAADPLLAPALAGDPGRRVPHSATPFEAMVRAIVGQQVSVAGARTVTGRIVATAGTTLTLNGDAPPGLTHVFPRPEVVAGGNRAWFPMPQRRATTILETAARVADGRIPSALAARDADVQRALLEVPGIGPWTAGYVAMRGFGAPDVFLPTDLGVRRGLAALGADADRAQRWRPYRSYALHHLWALAPGPRRKET